MKKFSVVLSIVLGVISCTAQQNQNRQVTPYDRVQVSGEVTVEYSSSDSTSVIVAGKESELEKVETVVENGVLKIKNKSSLAHPVTVRLKNNRLRAVEASGASTFRTAGPVTEDSIMLSATGASNLSAQLKTGRLECVGSGAASIHLEGEAGIMKANISGASSLKAYKLSVKEASVEATGASTAKVFVTEKIRANATGASDVKIKGEPSEIIADASSASSITRVKANDTRSREEGDTTSYNLKKKKILVISEGEDQHAKKMKGRTSDDDEDDFNHWQSFCIGVNGYTNRTGALTMPGNAEYMELNYPKSINLQFNPIEKQFNLVQNYMKIVTGLGIDHHMYSFSNRTILNADSTYITGRIDSSSRFVYSKNNLRSTYLQVPLLIEFNTSNNPKKTFHIALGVVGQYLIGSRTKQKFSEGNDDYTRVRKDNYNLNPFGAKAHVNLGYRNWTVFGEYNLTPLFQTRRGPELYPFTVGIRLLSLS